MAKLFHVHGPGNTVYFIERTVSGDKICVLTLKPDNSLEKRDITSPSGFKILTFERIAFSSCDDPKKRDVELVLAIIDD